MSTPAQMPRQRVPLFERGGVIGAGHLNELVDNANQVPASAPRDEIETLLGETEQVGDVNLTEVSRTEVAVRFENPDDPLLWVDVLTPTQVVMTDVNGVVYTFNYTPPSAP